MAIADNAYSRFIFWLKVLLPLIALAILSTLFLVAETLDPNKAIPYAEVDVEQILREQGVTRPTFGGTTESGATIILKADALRPEDGNGPQINGTAINLAIDLTNESTVTVISPNGQVDFGQRTATLTGGTTLTSSLGYRIATEALQTRLDRVEAETLGDVTATGPGVDIQAGRMTLTQRDAQDGFVLVFKDGVRLVYDPKTSKEEP